MSIDRKVNADERLESFQVLPVKLHVVVACAFNPERVDGARASLVDCEAVGKVYHFVFGTVNDEDGRGDLLDLVDAAT